VDTSVKKQTGDVVLDVRNLKTYFGTGDKAVHAVDDISFKIMRGKTLCIVGESGSGKSVTARSILQIVDPPGKIVSGEVIYYGKDPAGQDLAKLNDRGKEIRSIRGHEISMIFQEPMTSLSPIHTIGNQICEAILLHQNVDKEEARNRAIEL